MPSFTEEPAKASTSAAPQFPPITRDHILNCSYDSWFPKYRASCIKSRIIPLSPEFVEYIREDGIILADDDSAEPEDDEWEMAPNTLKPRVEELGSDSDESDSDDDEPPRLPPNQRFPGLHQQIKDKITELGGEVAPKLNWTAPKDAVWISPHQNTIKCTCPNDIYLLLKSSNFITYDLEHAFDDCTPTPSSQAQTAPSANPAFKPVLVLRSYFNPHTAMEFRCFVKHRNLVGISQRDLNYYEFLEPLKEHIVARISQLFNSKLRYTFPDGNFAFDVYIPEGEDEPLSRARLIDINPWAPHTDSLLFGWSELLEMEVPGPILGVAGGGSDDVDEQSLVAETIRLSIAQPGQTLPTTRSLETHDGADGDVSDSTDDDDDEEDFVPELRLIEKSDPAAYNFSSPQYSAHKLPKDVVDASTAGEGGMRDFMQKWKEMTEYRSNVASWEMDGNGSGASGPSSGDAAAAAAAGSETAGQQQ
ncbi:D123-domain-containing protein [Microdochium trichocladiopsis]|uniref:D123-domain-containing protein n=1 Tax=Microdochium trichocladiopsis TaxID=1682393 RepID=A0A9P8YK04_9PEZI|nr:D123-domain-containing protein [Microdochium trichocladiopsis]KAH7041298.1 D123-domain-containing protein [Microdochium trichocladiopsis]